MDRASEKSRDIVRTRIYSINMIDQAVSEFLTHQIAEGDKSIAVLRSAMSKPNASIAQLAVIENLLFANHRLQHVLHATMADLTRASAPTLTAVPVAAQPAR